MWAVSLSPIPPRLFVCRSTRQPLRTLSRFDGVYGDDIGGLGHTLLTNLNFCTNNPVPKPHVRKQADGKQISGSDVLWAFQRAATAEKKKKNNTKRRELSSTDTHKEDDDVDYTNVKTLCINTERARKLDKRLQELSEFNFLV